VTRTDMKALTGYFLWEFQLCTARYPTQSRYRSIRMDVSETALTPRLQRQSRLLGMELSQHLYLLLNHLRAFPSFHQFLLQLLVEPQQFANSFFHSHIS
jgi:hypothetical protein